MIMGQIMGLYFSVYFPAYNSYPFQNIPEKELFNVMSKEKYV